MDDTRGARGSEPQVLPNPFAEEAARVMAVTTAQALAGGPGAARPTQAKRGPDQQAPIIEPRSSRGARGARGPGSS